MNGEGPGIDMKTKILTMAVALSMVFPLMRKVNGADIDSGNDDILKVFEPVEKWALPSGQEIRATIQNAIFSFNLQTPIVAVVDEPAVNPKNGLVIFPRKTRLLGTADILKSDDRVNIRFHVAVLPTGREFDISGIALSPDGSAGIRGTVKEYKDVRLMTSAVSGALSGVGQVVTTSLPGQPLVAGAIGGALTQVAQEAQNISNQKVDVSVSVPPFQKTIIFLTRRLSLDEMLAREKTDRKGHMDSDREKRDEDSRPKDWKKSSR